MRVLVASFLLLSAAHSEAWSHPGVGVVVDSRGRIFYTDLSQVWMIDSSGRRTVAVPAVHTHELYLDAGDTLYGEHLWYEGDATRQWGHRVWKRTPDGTVSDVIPKRRGFLTDYSFVRDHAGNMYWAGVPAGTGDAADRTLIFRRAPNGSVSVLAGGSAGSPDGRGARAGFKALRWMTCTADGTVYAVDSGNLRRIERDGAVRTVARILDRRAQAASTANDQHMLMGLWAAEDRTVYVANYGDRELLRVDAAGNVTVFATSRLPWSPTGVTVFGDHVLVLEEGLNKVRVRQFSPSGKEVPVGIRAVPSRKPRLLATP